MKSAIIKKKIQGYKEAHDSKEEMCRDSGFPVASTLETAQVGGPHGLKYIKIFPLSYTQEWFISAGIK